MTRRVISKTSDRYIDHGPKAEELVVARNQRLDTLTGLVRDFLTGLPGTNCLLTGPTGVGKTLLANVVCDRIEREELAEPIHIDCWDHYSTYLLYRELLRQLGDHVGFDERGLRKSSFASVS